MPLNVIWFQRVALKEISEIKFCNLEKLSSLKLIDFLYFFLLNRGLTGLSNDNLRFIGQTRVIEIFGFISFKDN